EYFIVNLNGRAYDDGAMAELGVAFGAGKPIILFKNDIRTFYKDRIHPTFNAISYSYPTVSNFEKIPSAIEKVSNFINKFGENKYFSMKPPNVTKFYNYGLKWFKRLEKRTPPISQMEIWNKKELNN
ncbi:MAG: hypothetical protein GY870_00315, partial [archaeon]|nr:hypothetical protein [archaeon]